LNDGISFEPSESLVDC